MKVLQNKVPYLTHMIFSILIVHFYLKFFFAFLSSTFCVQNFHSPFVLLVSHILPIFVLSSLAHSLKRMKYEFWTNFCFQPRNNHSFLFLKKSNQFRWRFCCIFIRKNKNWRNIWFSIHLCFIFLSLVRILLFHRLFLLFKMNVHQIQFFNMHPLWLKEWCDGKNNI